ncbi:hypothetical protein [Terriglobus saanensis]|uniref:hypothetical protein n=1 Tax=Terriglobus saanensis TaxID=870903 RepID=UPI0001E5082D|nr:hypothetical protein [Terriglobus saanensis]
MKQNRSLQNVDRLLLTAGLANSKGEAQRKRSEKVVRIEEAVITEPRYILTTAPITLTVRLGKRVKLVTVT